MTNDDREWERELVRQEERRKRDIERFVWMCVCISMAAMFGLVMAFTGKGLCELIT